MAKQSRVKQPKVVSLGKIATDFERDLPMVFTVHDGFLGIDDMHSFTNGEVLFIYKVQSQKRFLLKEPKTKRVISVPSCHPTFKVTSRKGESPMNLSEVAEKHATSSPTLDLVVCKKEAKVSLLSSSQEVTTGWMNKVHINFEECFDEKYLVVFGVMNNGGLGPNPWTIPLYVPIKLSASSGSDVAHLRSQAQQILKSQNCALPTNLDIMIYNKDVQQLSEYDSLVPQRCIGVYESLDTSSVGAEDEHYYKKVQRKAPSSDPFIPQDCLYADLQELQENIYSETTSEANKKIPPPLPRRPHIPKQSGSGQDVGLLKQKQLHVTPPKPAKRVLSIPVAPLQVVKPERDSSCLKEGRTASEDVEVTSETRNVGLVNEQVRFASHIEKRDVKDFSSLTQAKDPRSLTVAEVQAICEEIGLSEKAAANLKLQKVDGSLLYDLCQDNLLKSEVNLTNLEAIKLKKAIIDGWRPK